MSITSNAFDFLKPQSVEEYSAEFAAVKRSLLATTRDLERALIARGCNPQAVAVGEAASYLRGAFRSLEIVLESVRRDQKL